jgi:tetrahydromethanopterin S-methyltransferase subunit D
MDILGAVFLLILIYGMGYYSGYKVGKREGSRKGYGVGYDRGRRAAGCGLILAMGLFWASAVIAWALTR